MRIIRWLRWSVAAAAIAAAIRWALLAFLFPPRLVAQDADTGELLGFQVSPLTRAQRDAYLEAEAAIVASAWSELEYYDRSPQP